MIPRRSVFFGPLFLSLALVAEGGCAGAGVPQPGVVRPKAAGIDRKAVTGDELAKLLGDNPFAIANREREEAEEKRVAEEKAKDAEEKAADAKADAEEAARKAKQEKVEALMKKAGAALESKSFDVAQDAAKQVIALDGENYPYAYVILGDTFLEAHDYGKALEAYKKAMELDPNDGWAAQRAAQALSKLKRPTDARDLLRKYVAAHPDADADTWDALAWLELDTGDLKKAEAAFQSSVKASNGKDAEAWYGLAMIAAHRNDPDATARALEALFALEPERRLVIERDPTFFRARLWPNVRSLFSPQKMAEAKKAADAKAKGLAVGGGPSVKEKVASKTSSGTKLAVPGGKDKTIAEQIRFDFDSAKLKKESEAVLDEIAGFLKSEADGIDYVEIEGHADKVGDDAYNVKLSLLRAQTVRNALIARGVPAAKLTAKGYGNFCPVDSDTDADALAKNRRVQFAIAAGGKVYGDELSCNEKMRKWLKPSSATAKLVGLAD
jgi:outer membrane protein OmpA-like peptidoglycan-associated protein/Tfp pilus assembly protein PilF